MPNFTVIWDEFVTGGGFFAQVDVRRLEPVQRDVRWRCADTWAVLQAGNLGHADHESQRSGLSNAGAVAVQSAHLQPGAVRQVARRRLGQGTAIFTHLPNQTCLDVEGDLLRVLSSVAEQWRNLAKSKGFSQKMKFKWLIYMLI